MPSIGHLDRLRRALADPVRISTGAIACDHLNAGMLAQPIGKSLGLPIREQVYHLVALEVDEDGAVAMAASPGPIVHPKDRRRRRWHLGPHLVGYHPQQRVGTGRNGKPVGQPSGGFTAQGKGDVPLQITEPGRPARRYLGDRRKGLSERLAGACGVEASEPPCIDPDRCRTPLPRQVTEFALISAVKAP